MKRLGCIVTITLVIAVLVCLYVPIWEIPYFETEPLKYEATSYIEKGQPGETIKGIIYSAKDVPETLVDYIVPYSFPIGHVIIKNVEAPVPEESVLSEEDTARLAALTQRLEKMNLIYAQHFSKSVWEQKPLWEREGRSIIAYIPLSIFWRRYIPTFEYGITPEDVESLLWQVESEMSALESKKQANSHGYFDVYVKSHTSGKTYLDQDGIGLIPGTVGALEFRMYKINMDKDEWSWEYEVSPSVKWVTKHKHVPLYEYYEYWLSRF